MGEWRLGVLRFGYLLLITEEYRGDLSLFICKIDCCSWIMNVVIMDDLAWLLSGRVWRSSRLGC